MSGGGGGGTVAEKEEGMAPRAATVLESTRSEETKLEREGMARSTEGKTTRLAVLMRMLRRSRDRLHRDQEQPPALYHFVALSPTYQLCITL